MANKKDLIELPKTLGELKEKVPQDVTERAEKAAKAVKGDLSDTGRFLTALKAVQFEAPNGRFRFDAYQNAVLNLYIRKVQPAAGGQFVNMPIDVLRGVEQYWPKGKPAAK